MSDARSLQSFRVGERKVQMGTTNHDHNQNTWTSTTERGCRTTPPGHVGGFNCLFRASTTARWTRRTPVHCSEFSPVSCAPPSSLALPTSPSSSRSLQMSCCPLRKSTGQPHGYSSSRSFGTVPSEYLSVNLGAEQLCPCDTRHPRCGSSCRLAAWLSCLRACTYTSQKEKDERKNVLMLPKKKSVKNKCLKKTCPCCQRKKR